MANYERTRKGIRNSAVAVAVQIVSLLVGFFSRKIFLDYLGTEVLGLNTTASSLLSFLNLAEMGIETAIAFTLYKPLYGKDEVSIREIIAIQGWFYRRVALFIIAGSLLLMPFFPLIFTKMQLPMWYAYGSYLVLLFSSLLGYFVNYKQVILTADQQDYKFQLSYRITMIVKVFFQMLAVRFLDHPYVWWLAIEALFAVVAALSLNSAVYRNYPFLKQSCRVDRELVRKYPSILSKIKQVFVHRMAFFVIAQATPILIYSFTSLSTVALYGNYMVIVNSLNALLVAIFSSLTACIGNMVAEGNKNLIMKVFRELFTTRFALVLFCSFSLWMLMEPFVTLWLGQQYVLDKYTLALIVAIFFIDNLNVCTESFLSAYGMFHDIWVPATRCILYVVMAVLFGRLFGLNGILLASLIDIFWVAIFWKPYFLFSKGFVEGFSSFFKMSLKVLLLGLAVWFIASFLLTDYPIFACALFAVVYFILLYIFEDGVKSLILRLVNSIKQIF